MWNYLVFKYNSYNHHHKNGYFCSRKELLLKITLSTKITDAKNLKFAKDFNISSVFLILTAFFIYSFFSVQEIKNHVSFFLRKSATTYWLGKNIHTQIYDNEIILKDVEFCFQNTDKNKIIHIKQSSDDLAVQKNAIIQMKVCKKQQYIVGPRKNEEFETLKRTLQTDRVNNYLLSDSFFGSYYVFIDYIVSDDGKPDLSQSGTPCVQWYIRQILNDLYTKKNIYYNNKSLGYCFYLVFSMRPPPILLR